MPRDSKVTGAKHGHTGDAKSPEIIRGERADSANPALAGGGKVRPVDHPTYS